MTGLLERDLDRPTGSSSRSGGAAEGPALLASPVLVGVLAAAQAVAATLLVVLLPVVGAWVLAPVTGATWEQAVRVAASAWLMALGAGVAVDGGEVRLLPWLLTAAMAALAVRSGRHVTPAPGPGAGWSAARGVAAATGTWALAALAVGLAASGGGVRPVVWQAVLGAAVLAAVGGCAGVLRARAGARRLSGSAAWGAAAQEAAGLLRMPVPLRAVVRGAAAGGAALLAVGAALVAALLVLGREEVLVLWRALDPGVVGGAALLLGQASALPTAVGWAVAFVAGPGFAVGTGTSVAPGAVELGALPAVPVLAALPAPGPLPGWALAAPVVVVVAGAVAGVVVRRRWADGGRLPLLAAALGVAAATGGLAGLLALSSRTSAGPGRMADLGPSPLHVALWVALEAALGAVLVVAVLGPRGSPTGIGPALRTGVVRASGASAEKVRSVSAGALATARRRLRGQAPVPSEER